MKHDKQAITGIPPVLAQALGGIANAPAQARAGMLEAYKKALVCHDWSFEQADDHSAYSRGRENLAQIQAARRELDPTGEIWNRYAPEGYKVLRCPPTERVPGDIVGCGSQNVTQPDREGLSDCVDCGMWFRADEADASSSAAPVVA